MQPDVPVVRPIPQQQYTFDAMSEDSSQTTPSGVSFLIDQYLPKDGEYYHRNNVPTPTAHPEPFVDVDFTTFHASFDSPPVGEPSGLSPDAD